LFCCWFCFCFCFCFTDHLILKIIITGDDNSETVNPAPKKKVAKKKKKKVATQPKKIDPEEGLYKKFN